MRIRRAAGVAGAILFLPLAVLPALGQRGPRGGERFALLVAVRQYEPSELRSLKYTEADIEELADVLERAGFPRENIRVMTQTRGADRTRLLPTAANIRTELGLMLKNMDEADRVVVALAGHGVQLAGGEESYFCPADARLNDPATLIPLSQVYGALERCGAGSKVLLVDACRNDPLTALARDAGRPIVDLPSLTRPLKKRTPGGVAALFSCSEGERAFEHPDLKHGVFFHFVLKGLQGDADFDDDGQIDFDELAAYAKKRVYRFVESEFRVEQTPELLGKGNLIDLISLDRRRAADGPVTKAESRPSQSDQEKTELASRTSPSTTPRPNAPEPGKPITSSIGMKLVLIPAGEFQMGSPDDDEDAYDIEKPRHRVRITRPFYLGATEVTQGEYKQVMGKNPSYFSAGGVEASRVAGQSTDRHPVEQVSWNDAIAFCNKLSERDGLAPYYQFGAGARSGGDGYRLPTKAEWEYACRAGSTTRYSFGDDAASLGECAWYNDNSGSTTQPVGQRLPNAFGLYDMHGNVLEWCWDGFQADYYKESTEADPSGPSQATGRVHRGGSWRSSPRNARSAFRYGFLSDYRSNDLGFRVARVQSGR